MRLYLNAEEFVETEEPLDLSLSLRSSETNVRAWYVNPPKFEPVRENGFLGSVKEGGAVNFRDVYFNPHGHGTHTECLGHITEEVYSINEVMKTYFCKAQLVSLSPVIMDYTGSGEMDEVLLKSQFEAIEWDPTVEAIIIRTLPNEATKTSRNYSASNPPFLALDVIDVFDQFGIKHLLIDTPSVDRESDGGALAFHHAFWGVPERPNFERTITELIYVSNEIKDGVYLMDLQVAPFENDAAPSRPLLYKIYKTEKG
jgi:arylformamidase